MPNFFRAQSKTSGPWIINRLFAGRGAVPVVRHLDRRQAATTARTGLRTRRRAGRRLAHGSRARRVRDPGAPAELRLSQWRALRTLLGPGPFADAPERQLELEASRDAAAIVIGE